MFPSTTAAPSTYVPPAASMSGPERREAGALPALEVAERGGDLRPVAQRSDGQVVVEEVGDDPAHVGVDPDVLGRAAARG